MLTAAPSVGLSEMLSAVPSGKKPSYFSLQAGRGIAAIMVVIFHTTSFLGGDARYWHREWLSVRFFGFALGVEYFFVLSGAVILLAHFRDIGQPGRVLSYFWKRVRRVYPIYWLVLTVLVLEYLLRPGLSAAYPYETDPWVIASGYLLVHLGTLQVNLPVAWTLFHEVLFYAVFAVLLLSRKLGYAAVAVWCGLSVLMIFKPWGMFYGVYLFSPLHLLFAFGMLAAWLLLKQRVPVAGVLLAGGFVLFVSAIVWAGRIGDLTNAIELLAGAGATLIVVGAARLEERGRLRVPRFLRFFGDASYSIYLIHYPFFMFFAPFVYKAWVRAVGHHVAVPLVFPFVLMTVAAIAVGCAMYVGLERPLLRRLTGARGTAAASATVSSRVS
jgi:peptidoglycan/LPS O-acetylase OafA/YrhL